MNMDQVALRNFKDFLLLYNKISESCFTHCVNQLDERDLTQDETRCVDVCTKKFVNINHKVMQIYMEVQPQIISKRMEEMNKQQSAIAAVKKELEEVNKSDVTEIKQLKINTADR